MAPSPKITKDRIKNALIILLNSFPLESITIKQLCDKAEISRTSFYHYYNNLDEILKELFDESFETSFGSKKWDLDYLYSNDFITDVVDFFDKNTPLLLALQKWELIQFVANKKAKILNQKMLESMTYKSSNYSSYILTFLMGRYFIVCSQWIKNGKIETKEDLITLLFHLQQFPNDIH